MIERNYTKDFYNNQKDGSLASAKVIVPIILQYLREIESVIDLGCGVGTWLSVFKECGTISVIGVDGAYVEKNSLYIKQTEFVEYDLTKPVNLHRKFNLAISLEVAEHLHKDKAKTFVDSLCSHSDIVLFSAATPNQGGVHHVNEQWPSYWASLFKENGYVCIDCLRPQIWNDEDIEIWYRQNMMFYVKDDPQITNRFSSNNHIGYCLPLDAVHPNMLKKGDLISVKSLIRMQIEIFKKFFPISVRAIKRRLSKLFK